MTTQQETQQQDDRRLSAFDPARYLRSFSDGQIVEHLAGCLRLVAQVEEETGGIPDDLRPLVFGVAQAMRASMEPRGGVQVAPAAAVVGLAPRGRRR